MTLQEAKERVLIADLWREFGYEGEPKKQCRCPFHENRSPSFSVYDDGKAWKCFAGCGEGSAVDFIAKAKGMSNDDACRETLRRAEGNQSLIEPDQKPTRRPNKLELPPLVPYREEIAQSVADSRGLNVRAVEFAAVFLKTVVFARVCNEKCWILIPSRQKLLDDWFYEGDLGFIFAPRGIGKTWLGMGLSTALSAGTTCGPWQAHGRYPVLYVDGEMPCESIEKRIRGMGGVENLKVLSHEVLFHLSNKVLNLGDFVTQEVITELLVAMKIKVLVLDNLSCLFSGVAENDADSWECVLQCLTLRRHRIAVVLIHHSGRNTKTMRGTSRREDAAFWVIRLDEIDDEHRKGARFISRFTKDRNSVSEQGAIEWGFVTHGNGMVEITTRPASSLDVFRQWIDDGLTGADEIAQEMGITKGAVSKLAKKGIEAGWLTKHGRDYVLI